MPDWRIAVAAFALPVAAGILIAWDDGAAPLYFALACCLGIAIGVLPLALHALQQRRRARSYARLLSRVR